MSVQLHHLNADSSWIIELPVGDGATFSCLVDPWLRGHQIDFFSSFSKQWHGNSKPTYDSIASLRAAHRFDAVIISHDFSDHCHQETLEQIESDVPVFAGTKEAVARVKGFKHFKTVVGMPSYAASVSERWLPSGTVSALTLAAEQGVTLPASVPKGLSFAYLPTKAALDSARLHGVVLIACRPPDLDPFSPSPALLYTPHGVPSGIIELFAARHAEHLAPLALLHSLDYVANPPWLGGPVALGHRSAVDIAALLRPRLLVSTHDEDDKVAVGLVARVLKRTKAPPLEDIDALLAARGVETRCRAVSNGGTLRLRV